MQRRTGKIIERKISEQRIQETGKTEGRKEEKKRGHTKGTGQLGSQSLQRERGEMTSGRGEARREFILPETALVLLPGRKHCSRELSTDRSSRDGQTALPGLALGCSEHPESSAERGWGSRGGVLSFPYPDGLARGGQ